MLIHPSHSRSRWTIQKWVEAMGGLVVASTSITAIELTIKWNHIPAVVNQATTAAQLIPLLLVVALIVTFLYAYVRSTSCADSSSDSDGGITLSFPSSPSGGGRRPTFSSGGSGSEPPIVIVRQGRSRSRTQSEPEIIRVFYPSPTHRRTRPRGPRPPPERDRPSSPGGDSVRGPRIIDVRPPPRPSSSSSSSSSSSGFDPRVNICRYPPYYQFPHIFRRPPLQSSSTTPAASAPTRTNTTTIAILGGSGWRHIATNEDPNQLRPIPHPQAASPVRASSSAPRVLAYLDRSESLSPRRPSPETISSTVGSTEEAAAGAASEPPVSAPAAPAEQAASEPVGASEPAAGAEPAEQTADRKEAQLDSEMKEEEHHNKLWEEFRNPKPILTGEDIEQVMAGPPDILTDAEIDSCLRADSVLSDAEVEAYMASRKGFFDKEDVAATMKGTSYYCDEDVKAADAGRISQEEVDEVVKKGLMTDSEVEDLLHPQIRQPTVEEEGGLSTTARVGAEYNITTDVKMDTVSEDEGGEESGVTILEIPKK
ncbi:hypothetical protein QBC38DRAFT_17633 [Podospora fimiseda]|uniref:Uncharacterized protein n=1 Tax=Podospora fimiseda TaxID=252190 RepID=A0AAN7GQ91_9PEZI|nr:hypothetical protein QBC38DRAFT_17633 [Podospora fimiseda]